MEMRNLLLQITVVYLYVMDFGIYIYWMNNSSLKLNKQKKPVLIISHVSRSPVSICPSFVVGTDIITAISTAKFLGVTTNATMNPEKHITNTVRSVNMQLLKLSSIQRYLSDSAVETLVQSTVISRLDCLQTMPIQTFSHCFQCTT